MKTQLVIIFALAGSSVCSLLDDLKFYTPDVSAIQANIKSVADGLLISTHEEITCEPVGTFDTANGTRYRAGLPNCDYQKTRFLLTVSTNPSLIEELDYNDTQSVSKSNYNASCPTIVIIHAFLEHVNRPWIKTLQQKYFSKYPCVNVIRVSWEEDPIFNYVTSTRYAEFVGRQTAVLINLCVEEGANISDFHIIGLSLAAHTAGFSGKFLKSRYNLLAGRITGLDPAGPLFSEFSDLVAHDSLKPTDANFVDVIHTDGGSIALFHFGYFGPLGHVDFYVNGGRSQPGCKKLLKEYPIGCNHIIVASYFLETFDSTPPKFRSFPAPDQNSYPEFLDGKYFSCSSGPSGCGILGEESENAPGRGVQYLLTTDQEKYYGRQYKITITPALGVLVYITLSDGVISTDSMQLTPLKESQVIIGKFVQLDWTKNFIATFYVPQSIQVLTVTNEYGNSKCYKGGRFPGLPKSTFTLQDNC